MVIDFHTHVFPSTMAAKTLDKLSAGAGITPYTNGTVEGLKCSMKKAGIDFSVTLPVATRPGQARTIADYAVQVTGKDGIISFGSIHPASDNWRAELNYIAKAGLKGVKLHPDYQRFFIDDKKIFPIVEHAASLGLMVLFHSGIDIGLADPVHCRPKAARKLIDSMRGAKLIFAHTGGYGCWDEVEDYLVGADIYFDISFTFKRLTDERLMRIIRAHGVNKCLFGTDSPWGSQQHDILYMKSMDFTKDELDAIMYNNAAQLLGIGKTI
ncbi:MAG: amidohydrolase family protein [Firmicutes bacterium]|nr:amidohydrolase family protein [Bacillota bacterium]